MSARELHARRAGKARAAWLGFMRARRVRRVGEAVVARHPNPIPIPMPHPSPNSDLKPSPAQVVARDEASGLGRGLGYTGFCGPAYLRGGPVMFARRLLEA